MIRTSVSKEYIDLIHHSPDPLTFEEVAQLSPDPVLFTEQVRILKGKKFSFKDRDYLLQIYRDLSQRIYISKGRQTEISEFYINLILYNMWRYSGTTHLYLSDRQSHTDKFSNVRMKLQAIKNSEEVQKIINYKDHTASKMFSFNGSICYFQSAWSGFIEANSVPADFIYVDEIQDINLIEFPTLLSALDHSKYKRLYCVGIGPDEGSAWDKLFLSGKQFFYDKKTKVWNAKNPTGEFSSYNIPQTIVPWITPKEIARKKLEYTDAQFRKLVMGLSAKGDAVPLSLLDLEPSLKSDLYVTMPDQVNRSLGPIMIGIDYGGGTKAFTVSWVEQYIDTQIPISKLLYATKITDKRPEDQLRKLRNIMNAYEPDFGVQDDGGGTHQKMGIEEEFGYKIIRWNAQAPSNTPYVYDKLVSNNMIKVNHTYMLEAVFDRFKIPVLINGKEIWREQLPNAEPKTLEWIAEHLTSMTGRLRTNSYGQQHTIYEKGTEPNDALMAKAFSLIAFNLWKRNKTFNDDSATIFN